ncbi:hypothetical protein QTP88_011650 [Uroleucon formosanum]
MAQQLSKYDISQIIDEFADDSSSEIDDNVDNDVFKLDDDEPEFTNLLPVPFDINEHEIEIVDNNEVLAVPLDPPVENIIEVVNDAFNWGFESSDDEIISKYITSG